MYKKFIVYHMASAKCNLLCLREEFIHSSVQHELSDWLQGYQFLRPYLGSIEDIKVEAVLVLLRDGLDCECPFWVAAIGDCFL